MGIVNNEILEHLFSKFPDNLSVEELNKINRLFSKSELESKKNFFSWLENNYSCLTASQAIKINNNIKKLSPESSYFIKTIFYDYIISQFIKGHKKEIFASLINEIYQRLYWCISSYHNEDEIIETIEYICKQFPEEYSLDKEYFNCLSRMLPGEETKAISIIKKLSYQARTDILYRSVNSSIMNNFHLRTLLDSTLDDPGYEEYISSEMYDGSNLCRILTNAHFFASDHENLKKILIREKHKCAETINKLLDSAAKEKIPTLIIELQSCFPNKKILQKLIEVGNDKFILKFIDYNPELKDLMIYY